MNVMKERIIRWKKTELARQKQYSAEIYAMTDLELLDEIVNQSSCMDCSVDCDMDQWMVDCAVGQMKYRLKKYNDTKNAISMSAVINACK